MTFDIGHANVSNQSKADAGASAWIRNERASERASNLVLILARVVYGSNFHILSYARPGGEWSAGGGLNKKCSLPFENKGRNFIKTMIFSATCAAKGRYECYHTVHWHHVYTNALRLCNSRTKSVMCASEALPIVLRRV